MESTVSAVVEYPGQPEERYELWLERIQARFLAHVTEQSHLFTTDATGLFDAYLAALPPERRQYYTCHACRDFLQRFGGLVTIDAHGVSTSAIWHEEETPKFYQAAVQAMVRMVRRASVMGVFLTSEEIWGKPITGHWCHFAVTPPGSMRFRRMTQTAGQVRAEKREDFRTLATALQEFSPQTMSQAVTLLKMETLYRSEKCLGVAEWLLSLQKQRAAVKGDRARENLLWKAVAEAPVGFCHPRSSMIGTLLSDLAEGMSFAEVKTRFDAKMHPLRYQRPQAAPSVGNIQQAERLVEQMGIAASLRRRFARLDEVEALWRPRPVAPVPTTVRRLKIEDVGTDRLRILLRDAGINPATLADDEVLRSYRELFGSECVINSTEDEDRARNGGVFSHLTPKGTPTPPLVPYPPATMTWEKFSRTVLPEAQEMSFFIAQQQMNFTALLTAVDPTAPPILQWDRAEQRNPVSWYVWQGGSPPSQWRLTGDQYCRVSAITLKPSMWHDEEQFRHQGQGVIFLLEGARETKFNSLALFPETLKSELHGVRATIEAYSQAGRIEGAEEASACGILLPNGHTWNAHVRVRTSQAIMEYRLDRWD